MPNVSSFLPQLVITPKFVWSTLAAALVIFILLSLVLIYHWLRFSLKAKKMTAVILVYLAGAGLLLLAMFIAAGYYQISA